MKNFQLILYCILFTFLSCNSQTKKSNDETTVISKEVNKNVTQFDKSTKTIHIFVALCDNKYQGIVPVPAKIGNGQDPNNNLYWGCGFGIRTYFKNSKEWKLVKTQKLDSTILERLIFKHTTKNCYLVADAYNGKYIEECTREFLKSSAGQVKDTVQINNKT